MLALPLMLAGTALLITERHAHRHRHDDAHHTHNHAPGEIPESG